MNVNKRFELYVNPQTNTCEIVDNVASNEKNGMVIYNDLGGYPFTAAPTLCELLNKLSEENERLKKEDNIFFGKVFDILLKYQDLFNREMADEVLEELGIELTRWFE